MCADGMNWQALCTYVWMRSGIGCFPAGNVQWAHRLDQAQTGGALGVKMKR
jgi:hypothetical protein